MLALSTLSERGVGVALRDAWIVLWRNLAVAYHLFLRALGSPSGLIPPREQTPHSHVLVEVRDAEGNLKYRSVWRHNLTTDTAVGYTNRRDWQSKAFGGGLAYPDTDYAGTASAADATSLTASGFPTAGQGLAGSIVAVGPNASGAGSTVFGVIVSNSATVLTVDQWYDPDTLGVGTTPNATATYQILPGQMPAIFIGVTEAGGSPAASDTTLPTELTVDGFTRALATWAHTAAATTYTLTRLFTASGTRTITRCAVFGAANTTGGGVMPFTNTVTPNAILVSGDTLTITITVTIN